MSRPHALALTERQMRIVQKHSAGLKLQMRDRFLQVVADRLTGEVSDDALMAAINLALDHLHAFRQAKAAS